MRSERQERLRERLLGNDEARAAISLRAYDIYRRRGGEPGHEIEDWVQAENEILEALHEIAAQVSRLQALRDLQAKRTETLKLATRAHELAQIAFRAGLTDYVNVLTTESQLNGARNSLAQVSLQQIDAVASLNQALGAGESQ